MSLLSPSTKSNPSPVSKPSASIPASIRTVALALIALPLLTACLSAPPDRLKDSDFDSWVTDANDYVMQTGSPEKAAATDSSTNVASSSASASAAVGVDPELNRVAGRIDKLVEYAQRSDSEASWVIRNWSTNSRKIGTLFDYFLTRGYLLNYRYQTLGGNFFIPMGRDRYGLTYASTGLSQIFGEKEIFIAPWIVNDDDFTFATNYGPAPFLNRERAEELKSRILSGAKTDESVSLGVDLGVVMQMLAAREVARSTLNTRYAFNEQAEFNIDSLLPSIPGLSIESADDVHQFFAQASSLAAHPFGIYLLVADTLNVMDELGKDQQIEYARTANGNFFVSSVNEILARLGRPYDVDSAFRVSTLRVGQRGLDDLRADYVQYAKTILNHIESKS